MRREDQKTLGQNFVFWIVAFDLKEKLSEIPIFKLHFLTHLDMHTTFRFDQALTKYYVSKVTNFFPESSLAWRPMSQSYSTFGPIYFNELLYQ